MARKRDIDIEVTMTVHGGCDISCEVFDDEARFILGRTLDGLRVDFDWPALDKFMRVVAQVMKHMRQIPRGEPIEFMVCADEHSRQEHFPESRQPDGVHVVA
jgi:hypothetical protein